MSKIKGSSVRLPVKVDSVRSRSVRGRSGWNRPAKLRLRGVTLIELMIVVAMVSVLATLATVGYRRYIANAKTGEATNLIGTIKSGQEAFKAETFRYLRVSPDLATPYPQGELSSVGTSKYAWEGGSPDSARKNFRTLGVSTTAPVLYGYAAIAGAANQDMPNLPLGFDTPTWPDPGGPWYVVVAMGDLDGDGINSGYASSSLTAEIVALRPGE